MTEETQLQKNLRFLLDVTGKTARSVSLEITKTNDSLLKAILDGNSSNPRQDTLEKIADYFGVGLDEIAREDLPKRGKEFFAERGKNLPSLPQNNHKMPAWSNEVRVVEGAGGLPNTAAWPKDVPILGTAVGGNGDGEFYFNGEQGGWASRPPVLMGVKTAFAVYVVNDSMKPIFKPGKRVYIDPTRGAAIGDYVLVELHSESEEPNGPALLKQLVRRSASSVLLRQLNPPKDLAPIPAAKIKHIYRALEPDEWLGD